VLILHRLKKETSKTLYKNLLESMERDHKREWSDMVGRHSLLGRESRTQQILHSEQKSMILKVHGLLPQTL